MVPPEQLGQVERGERGAPRVPPVPSAPVDLPVSAEREAPAVRLASPVPPVWTDCPVARESRERPEPAESRGRPAQAAPQEAPVPRVLPGQPVPRAIAVLLAQGVYLDSPVLPAVWALPAPLETPGHPAPPAPMARRAPRALAERPGPQEAREHQALLESQAPRARRERPETTGPWERKVPPAPRDWLVAVVWWVCPDSVERGDSMALLVLRESLASKVPSARAERGDQPVPPVPWAPQDPPVTVAVTALLELMVCQDVMDLKGQRETVAPLAMPAPLEPRGHLVLAATQDHQAALGRGETLAPQGHPDLPAHLDPVAPWAPWAAWVSEGTAAQQERGDTRATVDSPVFLAHQAHPA